MGLSVVFLLWAIILGSAANAADMKASPQTMNVLGGNSHTIFAFPSNCTKNGKVYKQGEQWTLGHLRYRCGKFGAYEILGCLTDKGRELKTGEDYVEDNVAHQCFVKDSSVFYRMSVCGVLGQPGCDKLDHSTSLSPSQMTSLPVGPPLIDQSRGLPGLNAAGLPEGWKIVDAKGNPVPLTGIQVISRTIMVGPQSTTTTKVTQTHGRRRRQSGHGVGSVIGIEDVGNERPMMPGMGTNPFRGGGMVPQASKNERVVGVGTGSMDLNSRSPTITSVPDKTKYKPDTVTGTRSGVNWNGKTMSVDGRTVGVGPGTFTFGRSRTGQAFFKPT